MTINWPVRALGDVCHVIGGGTPPKDKEHYFRGTIPWATVRDMRKDIISETEFQITEEAVGASSTNIIPAHNVVIATRVGLGKVCFIERETAINQDLRGIVPIRKSELSVHYLFWWLKSIVHLIVQEGTGATVQGVKLPFIKSLEIPLPPLPEQNRIVAILDEAFAGIAAATANAEKNLANARDIFEAHLNRTFDHKHPLWTQKRLAELVDISHGYAFDGQDFRASDDQEKHIVLTPGNYTEDAELNFSEKNTKRYFGQINPEYVFQQGDLTVVMTDLSSKMKILGKPAFVEHENILHNQRIGRLLFENFEVDPRYVFYFMRTQHYLGNIKLTATGTMVRHTAPSRILSIAMPFPRDPREQRDIVANIDLISCDVQRLIAVYKRKLEALVNLKQAILQKAFSGELTARPEDALHEEAA